MKVEKINDKQIRCTISKADLTERKIKLSELACGTGNSKELFRDMIRQAAEDFDFEVDEFPLMVEAIPVSAECIVLIITKVENQEETESHFAQMLGDEGFRMLEDLDKQFEDATADNEDEDDGTASADPKLLFSIYRFENLNTVINLSKMLHPIYEGDSSLFKSPVNHQYYLSLCTDGEHRDSLGYVTNLLTEYGTHEPAVYNTEFFFLEHFECIIDANAIEKLSQL